MKHRIPTSKPSASERRAATHGSQQMGEGSYEATRMARGRKNHNRIEINGETGTIVWNLERMNELEVFDSRDGADRQGFRTVICMDGAHPYAANWWPDGHIIGYEHTFVHTFYDLLEAVADDRLPEPSFVDGVRNQRVLAAIEKAAASRRWVTV